MLGKIFCTITLSSDRMERMAQHITIAGSGPAGLTAAITLAHAGYTVDVHERNRDAGERFRGDVQGLENWSTRRDVLDELRGWNIAVNFACHPLTSLHVSNGDETIRVPPGHRPLAYLVKRGSVRAAWIKGSKRKRKTPAYTYTMERRCPRSARTLLPPVPCSATSWPLRRGFCSPRRTRMLRLD